MSDEKIPTLEECYTNFQILLDQRLSYSRKLYKFYLSSITFSMLIYFYIAKEPRFLKEILDDKIDKILDDCEIYFNMDRERAVDAMRELSNLATTYVADENNPHIYQRICNLMDQIKVSYPVN
jgi:hypothetical protein